MRQGGWLVLDIDDLVVEFVELASFEDLRPGHYAVLSLTDAGSGIPRRW